MVAVIGTVSPFARESQSWEEYSEMLEVFFEANEIDDADEKKAVLLSGVGSATYSLLRSLLSPETQKDKTYDELIQILQTHFSPKPSQIVQRFKFNSRMQKTGETVAEYVAELRRLAQHCEYGDVLPQMLRDRLVCGVQDDWMQRRLLSEADLTFEKALKLCQAMESASKDVKDLRRTLLEDLPAASRSYGGQAVHRLAMEKAQRKVLSCYRCNGQPVAAECKFASELCHKCGKRGHIKRACRSKMLPQVSHKGVHGGLKNSKRDSHKEGRAHMLREGEQSDRGHRGNKYHL
nr:uncharacterized protein LOC107375995 [Nothobranchius furzeri]